MPRASARHFGKSCCHWACCPDRRSRLSASRRWAIRCKSKRAEYSWRCAGQISPSCCLLVWPRPPSLLPRARFRRPGSPRVVIRSFYGYSLDMKKLTVGLIGNPNAGKTTLFNQLTGAHQRVGNWAGVTVERKEGFFSTAVHRVQVIDLPGTYSLTTISQQASL